LDRLICAPVFLLNQQKIGVSRQFERTLGLAIMARKEHGKVLPLLADSMSQKLSSFQAFLAS